MNRLSSALVSIHLDIEDRVERLRRTSEEMVAMKTSAQPFATFLAFQCFSWLPEFVLKDSLRIAANKCTLVLTNVPGPEQPLFYFGRQVHDMAFVPPAVGNVGVGVSILTYNHAVRFGITSDRILCDDAKLLTQAFCEEFKHYHELAGHFD